MKSAMALLALLAWAIPYVRVEGWEEHEMTYISNQSASKGITATITYDFIGNPGFIDRQIGPMKFDSDTYNGLDCSARALENPTPLNIELWVTGSTDLGYLKLCCDCSLVLLDDSAGNGLDVFQSVYQHINEPFGNKIITIGF